MIHLLAIAGRVGLDLTLDDWDRLGREVPTIVNLMPSGEYLMEEFFYAGGLPVVLRMLGEGGHLDGDALTVSGGPIWEEVREARNWNPEVIRPVERALTRTAGASPCCAATSRPTGAVLKPSAASPRPDDGIAAAPSCSRTSTTTRRSINGPEALDMDETCVMVLKNCGPQAAIPACRRSATWDCRRRSCAGAITDMVRISDARMSGTAYGTVVLHTAPEAAIGAGRSRWSATAT